MREATDLINNEMLGAWSESYLPLGYLYLVMGQTTDLRPQHQKRILAGEHPVENYTRTLTLHDAVERIVYKCAGIQYTRELFVSYPDNVLACRLFAQGDPLHFSLSMDSPLRHEQRPREHGFTIEGRAPDWVEPYPPPFQPKIVYHSDAASDSIRFAAAAKIIDTDGKIHADGLRVYVENASYAVVLMSAGTKPLRISRATHKRDISYPEARRKDYQHGGKKRVLSGAARPYY